jgi:hypothetical protein
VLKEFEHDKNNKKNEFQSEGFEQSVSDQTIKEGGTQLQRIDSEKKMTECFFWQIFEGHDNKNITNETRKKNQ